MHHWSLHGDDRRAPPFLKPLHDRAAPTSSSSCSGEATAMDHPPSAYRWMHLWLHHRSPQGRCKITSPCDLPPTTCSIVWSVRPRRHPPHAPHCRLHDVVPSSSLFACIVHLETPPPPRRPRRSPRRSPAPCTRAVVLGYRAATSMPSKSCTRAVVFAYVDRLTSPILHRSPFMMLHNHSS